MCYDYKDGMLIDAKISTTWMVKFENGCKQLQVWHRDAKIKDIAKSVKTQWPKCRFTVAAVDVGVFTIHHIDHSLSDGRKLNQDMQVVV
jgi:hypothetical protein